jgi:hypothetical protein
MVDYMKLFAFAKKDHLTHIIMKFWTNLIQIIVKNAIKLVNLVVLNSANYALKIILVMNVILIQENLRMNNVYANQDTIQ